MKTAITLTLLTGVAFGAIRGPGKYNGVVIFDRWDSCYLYSGVYLMAISEGVKEKLRPFRGKAVLIDALQVYQLINPGDGLITKLKVLGPAEDRRDGPFGRNPPVDGLSLRVAPAFPEEGTHELIIEVHNEGKERVEIETEALAPTLLGKVAGDRCWEPTDGPSYAAITRRSVRSSSESRCGARRAQISLAPGTTVATRLTLDPGEKIEVPLMFDVSPGEYEFLAGYGGGVHSARALASNQFGFEVDEAGRARLSTPQRPTARRRPPTPR